MAIQKNKKIQIIVISLLLFFIVPLQSGAIDAQFENITSFNTVREIRTFGDTTYFLTSGGMLKLTDFSSVGEPILNSNGLGTTDIWDMILDDSSQYWVVGNGRLIKYSQFNSSVFLFRDRDDNFIPLYTLEDDGDFIWVGSDIGLVIFSKTENGGQIQDSYGLFGNINPSPAVYDIEISGDSIWIATSGGIAYADKRDLVQLKSPSSWTVIDRTSYPDLNADTVNSIVNYNNEMYAATNRAVVALDIIGDSLISLPFTDSLIYAKIKIESDSLYYFINDTTGGGYGTIVDNQTTIWHDHIGVTEFPSCGSFTSSRSVLASGTGGIYFYGIGLFYKYNFSGLPSNNVSDVSSVVLNGERHLTAGFRDGDAAFLADNVWNELNLFRAGTELIIDSTGAGWIGTEGEGLWRLSDKGFVNYDENNSTMLGNTDNPPFGLTFVYVREVVTDGNFIYAACYRAANGYPVAIGDMSNLDNRNSWDSLGLAEGIFDDHVVTLDVYGSQIAIGMETVGLYWYDVGAGHYNHSDDKIIHYTTDNGFLVSNSIRKVKYSPTGILWVGTNFGISRFDPGFEFFVDIELPPGISSDITALEFDGRGNLWVGTVDGLAFWDATTELFQLFNQANSDLLSNKINNIHFENETGKLFVSTDGGISVLPSYTGQPTSVIEDVIAFPNPFVVSSPNSRLSFNYLLAATVNIYTVSGELVDQFPVTQSWDGSNSSGTQVASGVYLFVLTNSSGEVGRGKFLLVRN